MYLQLRSWSSATRQETSSFNLDFFSTCCWHWHCRSSGTLFWIRFLNEYHGYTCSTSCSSSFNTFTTLVILLIFLGFSVWRHRFQSLVLVYYHLNKCKGQNFFFFGYMRNSILLDLKYMNHEKCSQCPIVICGSYSVSCMHTTGRNNQVSVVCLQVN